MNNNSKDTIPEAMSIKKVAEYFGVSIRTVREWMEKDSKFPRPFKKFGTLRFRRSEIEEYWRKNTKGSNA